MELQEGSKESFGRYSQRLAIATVAQMKQKQPSQAYPARLVVCCRSPDIGMISSRSVIERETTPLKKFITYVNHAMQMRDTVDGDRQGATPLHFT